MKFISITDPGIVRQQNEDVFYASSKSVGNLPNLYFVADGMGGEKAGMYAAKTAANIVLGALEGSTETKTVMAISSAIQQANIALFKEAQSDPEKTRMGTTIVLATIEGDHLLVANVGDSRLYVSKESGIHQITRDHSFVDELVRFGKVSESEAKHHPKKHYITRAVGAEERVDIDFFDYELNKNDYVLLCSDGLTNMVSDQEINRILRSDSSLSEKAELLKKRANDAGGSDNITVIIIDPEI
jgi:protein phosphatase